MRSPARPHALTLYGASCAGDCSPHDGRSRQPSARQSRCPSTAPALAAPTPGETSKHPASRGVRRPAPRPPRRCGCTRDTARCRSGSVRWNQPSHTSPANTLHHVRHEAVSRTAASSGCGSTTRYSGRRVPLASAARPHVHPAGIAFPRIDGDLLIRLRGVVQLVEGVPVSPRDANGAQVDRRALQHQHHAIRGAAVQLSHSTTSRHAAACSRVRGIGSIQRTRTMPRPIPVSTFTTSPILPCGPSRPISRTRSPTFITRPPWETSRPARARCTHQQSHAPHPFPRPSQKAPVRRSTTRSTVARTSAPSSYRHRRPLPRPPDVKPPHGSPLPHRQIPNRTSDVAGNIPCCTATPDVPPSARRTLSREPADRPD